MRREPLSRRYFFHGIYAAACRQAIAVTRKKILIALIDGLDPAYIDASDMPTLRRLMRAGTYRIGKSAMPSLTNVNTASLATGTFPEGHGITANTLYDAETGVEVELADPKYLKAPTLLRRAIAKGMRTAFVGAKGKIHRLIGGGAQVSRCAENEGVPMYDAENSYWVLERGRELLRRDGISLLYLTTSDYMMHTYAPEHEESQKHLAQVDRLLGRMLNDHPKLELYLCADHGMNAKTVGLDPVEILAAKGVRSRAAAAIADAHKVHHKDLGGSVYIDLETPTEAEKARDILLAERGIEEVLLRQEAVQRFRLYPSRTGDLMVLGAPSVALGRLNRQREDIQIRSHGSLHETNIPLLVYGRKVRPPSSIVELTAARPWED
jgi:phosphonoacetate hydrolase